MTIVVREAGHSTLVIQKVTVKRNKVNKIVSISSGFQLVSIEYNKEKFERKRLIKIKHAETFQ